jgi:hypothetical protein
MQTVPPRRPLCHALGFTRVARSAHPAASALGTGRAEAALRDRLSPGRRCRSRTRAELAALLDQTSTTAICLGWPTVASPSPSDAVIFVRMSRAIEKSSGAAPAITADSGQMMAIADSPSLSRPFHNESLSASQTSFRTKGGSRGQVAFTPRKKEARSEIPRGNTNTRHPCPSNSRRACSTFPAGNSRTPGRGVMPRQCRKGRIPKARHAEETAGSTRRRKAVSGAGALKSGSRPIDDSGMRRPRRRRRSPRSSQAVMSVQTREIGAAARMPVTDSGRDVRADVGITSGWAVRQGRVR